MIRKIKAWLSRPSSLQYRDLLLRLNNLETALDTLIQSPVYDGRDGVGFNRQEHRKKIFRELCGTFRFEAIVETGTWIGNTTGYMALETKLPVYTCELNPRFHALARARLTNVPNVHFDLSDSRQFLKRLSGTELTQKRTFFYLDAHWYDGLPLEEELRSIAKNWKEFVIMVDDFQVPGDSGYGYDDFYDQKLDFKTFEPLFSVLRLAVFVPSIASSDETGSKRGCVVLIAEPAAEKFNDVTSVQKYR
jgi:hypothetical protein